MDLVSVIMPVFNSEKYLKRSIESVLNQTYKNLELIIVDDGSTDNSLEIISQYADIDNRIIVYNSKNNGPGGARNIGIKNSKGNLIQFIDSDDEYNITMVEKMYENIILMNSDIVICSYDKIDEVDNKKSYYINSLDNIKVTKQNKNKYDGLMFNLYAAHLIFDVWNKMYRADIIKKNNITFPTLSLGEDALFNLSYFQNSHSAGYIKDKLYNYYYINSSLMNKYKEDQFNIEMGIYNSFKKTLLNTNERSFIEKVGSDFLVEVVYGVINLTNKGCKYSNKEKYEKIISIINDSTAKEIIKNGYNSSKLIKLFQLLIKKERKWTLFLIVYFNLLRKLHRNQG